MVEKYQLLESYFLRPGFWTEGGSQNVHLVYIRLVLIPGLQV